MAEETIESKEETIESKSDNGLKSEGFNKFEGFSLTPNLILPADADARRLAFVGMSGSGKTSSAKVVVEHLARAGRRVAILDPAGVWSGLRVGSDGNSPGLPFVVFGGRSADVPLEASAGAAVADLVMEENLPVILDLSGFDSDADLCRVSEDFVRRLRFLQSPEREPLLLVVDEADLLAPQTARKEQQGSQRALINVARRSRSDGLGLLVITQRPAAITKDILTQAEAVFLLRFAGYTDLSAVDDWIGSYLSKEERQSVIAALPYLSEGEAYVTSPSWIRTTARVQFPLPATFDSSATPKAGAARQSVQARADVDLSALALRFTAAIEAERENDPEALKKRIAGLQAQLRDVPKPAEKIVTLEKVVEKVVEKIIEVPAFKPGQVEQLRDTAEALIAGGKDMLGLGQEILARVGRVQQAGATERLPEENGLEQSRPKENEPAAMPGEAAGGTGLSADDAIGPSSDAIGPSGSANVPSISNAPSTSRGASTSAGTSRPQQAILNALADFGALSVSQPRREHVALFAGASPLSSAYTNNLGSLRTAGLIEYPASGRLSLTDRGKEAAKRSGRLLTQEELHRAWLGRLTAPQRRILTVLIGLREQPVSRANLAERAGASATSSAFTNNLGALRSLGLLDYPASGQVAATKLLFPEGLPE